jgi:hypothetical protein
MKAHFGAFARRSLIVATLASSMFLTSDITASATSVTTFSLPNVAAPDCGVVLSPGVHVESAGSTCVIRVAAGTNVRIKMRSGFHWGNPTSNSSAVIVTAISRSSFGVNAVTLHAATLGHAVIRDTGIILCPASRACPDLALVWSVKVIVT